MQTSVLVARAVFVLRYWCASPLAFLLPNDSYSIFSVLGKGMDGRSKVDLCSVRNTFSAPHCRHRCLAVTATGILASCAEEFAKSRELARAVSRADAILVASRCLSPLERQAQLSHHCATLEFRTMVSGVLSSRFITLLAVSEDVGSHTESASNNTADNTRIISIVSDMTLVVGA